MSKFFLKNVFVSNLEPGKRKKLIHEAWRERSAKSCTHTKMIAQHHPTPSSPGEEGTLESVDEETVTIQWPSGSERKSVGLPEQ